MYFEALKVLFTLVRLVDTEEKVYLYFLVVMGIVMRVSRVYFPCKTLKTVRGEKNKVYISKMVLD